MKKTTKIFLLLLIVAVVSCSTKKDHFVSRSYNALTTKFNILYNGNLAFQEGLKEISQKHKDNFWQQLQIEPITFDETKIAAPKFKGNPSFGDDSEKKNATKFDKAEEKAVKAIQLHSMNIGGRERNSQIDDAYLLLGKSRYYTQRFIPAIEAFNYIIANYPYASLINETRIWRAKTNIRLDNDKLAIESLKIVLSDKEIEERIKEEAHTALGMAYVKIDSIQKAIEQLNLATETHENVAQTTRNLFVLGQIYASKNKKDSAAAVFQKLIDFKKAPYRFRIQSHLELAKVTTSDSVTNVLVGKLKKLAKQRENRKYLDGIYYQTGVLEGERDSLWNAIKYYKRALRVPNADPYQKTFAYEKLGDIYFEATGYILAGSYYDSVVQISKTSTEKRIRKIRRKYKSLKTLIDFEAVLQINDSVLRIAELSTSEQKTFFENHISKLKKIDEKKAKEQLNNVSFGSSFSGASSIKSKAKGKWYFYNTQSLNFGKSEFEKIWGNRALEDNWRISEIQKSTKTDVTDKKAENTILAKYELKTYLDALPKSTADIDSLKFQRNDALYQTGIIYKERFKDLDLAVRRLERLLTLNPDKSEILPINFLLYQLYTELKNQKANTFRKNILDNYSDTKFAKIITNTKVVLEEETITELDAIYKEIFYIYKEKRYYEVVDQITELKDRIEESDLIARFELLKAMAIGKYQTKENYKKALVYVSLNYANTLQGKRAKEILKQLN